MGQSQPTVPSVSVLKNLNTSTFENCLCYANEADVQPFEDVDLMIDSNNRLPPLVVNHTVHLVSYSIWSQTQWHVQTTHSLMSMTPWFLTSTPANAVSKNLTQQRALSTQRQTTSSRHSILTPLTTIGTDTSVPCLDDTRARRE